MGKSRAAYDALFPHGHCCLCSEPAMAASHYCPECSQREAPDDPEQLAAAAVVHADVFKRSARAQLAARAADLLREIDAGGALVLLQDRDGWRVDVLHRWRELAERAGLI